MKHWSIKYTAAEGKRYMVIDDGGNIEAEFLNEKEAKDMIQTLYLEEIERQKSDCYCKFNPIVVGSC